MGQTWIADQQYTIEYHLERSGRDALPLERSFVQRRLGNGAGRGDPTRSSDEHGP